MPKLRSKQSLKSLVTSAARGDHRAISRLMSMVENDPRARLTILSSIYWRTEKAYVVGVTGPPGCGKSTLISQLAKHYRDLGHRVGIVAVDPSSTITGGALLGDRIRMEDLASDPKVYIRSMATRGHSGGIALATADAVRILSASGMAYVIVETAGAGQSDVDIKTIAQTTIVVTAPGLGDEIQALKAGIMEIADIFVVNKADKENADRAAQEIHSIIMMSDPVEGWRPRVLKTVATTGEGVTELVEAIDQHAKHREETKSLRTEDDTRVRAEIIDAAKRYFEEVSLKKMTSSERFENIVKQVEAHRLDPYSAGRKLVAERRQSERA